MKKLENYGVQILNTEEANLINGGLKDPRGDDYNRVLGVVLFPFYDIGYWLGRI